VISAILVSLNYLYQYGGSAGQWFETVLWFFFRIIVPLAVLVLNVIIIREACRSSANTAEQTEQQGEQTGEDTPTNTAVPTAMIVTIALIYLTLDVLPTVFYTILYFVPDKEWCSRRPRPILDAIDMMYATTSSLYPLVYAYKFLVYMIAGREFRSALCSSPCCRKSGADQREIDAEVAANVPTDV